jgi:dTDP-glucose pyrophosphorylase
VKKFCILAAGCGTRNNNIVGLHKALLPLENKPVISHIIDRLDDVDIVIAVGYKSEQIKTYMNLVHSDKNITYVDVDNFDGVGSGPGYSLLCCKDELQEPFVFTSVDTLIGDDINLMSIEENWLGVASVEKDDSLNYCLVDGSKYLDNLYYGVGDNAYIGMAGIYEYDLFWDSLEKHKIIKDEYQVIHGFDGLEHMKLINFIWYDTGNNKSYLETKKVFCNDVVANKSDEAIFIDNGKVIKYFDDKNKVSKRLERTKYLNSNCPKIKSVNDNMYAYDYIDGDLLSNIYDESLMLQFLTYCKNNLWLHTEKDENFLDNCKEMYESKTKNRVKTLSGSDIDNIEIVNGVKVEPIEVMLSKINWTEFYSDSIPTFFHGDLQPENTLFDSVSKRFVLIDWRQQFGDSLKVGDVYYDLAKLYHAIMINGQTILKDMFDCNIMGKEANVSFYAKSNLVFLNEIFRNFCHKNDYRWDNIQLLGILQYFSICTLYDNFKDGKYGKFLFLYGKYQLSKFMNRSENNEKINRFIQGRVNRGI